MLLLSPDLYDHALFTCIGPRLLPKGPILGVLELLERLGRLIGPCKVGSGEGDGHIVTSGHPASTSKLQHLGVESCLPRHIEGELEGMTVPLDPIGLIGGVSHGFTSGSSPLDEHALHLSGPRPLEGLPPSGQNLGGVLDSNTLERIADITRGILAQLLHRRAVEFWREIEFGHAGDPSP